MNANDVIESYVTDVAVQLPRKQRNDVAFELRALIDEGLQDKADAAGRGVDATMATEFLQTFGHPDEVAARYRPALTIIDPADGHNFLRVTVIGLAIIWFLGLLIRLGQPIGSAGDVLNLLGQWWTGTAIPSLWWPGVLVVWFGMAAWARRRRPQTSAWKPRAGDRLYGGRVAMTTALVGILCGLYVLIEPRWVLDFFWNGRAAPAAYQALTYTDTFLRRQAPWMLLLLALNIPLFATVIVKGHWSDLLRRIETGLALATCAAMAWIVLDGPVFKAQASDQVVKFFLVLGIAYMLYDFAIKRYRQVRPAPN
ncbi:hypothetical protein CSC74_15635 [Pseudoxanthomonas yeongjuensis]|uniref:hypothetical protein n=1 Tax=Pseudoxanthomonas yeongjuensis TaxID=377616 RepID=UPI0013913E8B|nr:hypothetical protein [Pseudoxanthomonas yeongjuensis]KAF1714680.1 hypothetical protein CSC74_15635 [Pseudoxanthomonas yeongjuensis]